MPTVLACVAFVAPCNLRRESTLAGGGCVSASALPDRLQPSTLASARVTVPSVTHSSYPRGRLPTPMNALTGAADTLPRVTPSFKTTKYIPSVFFLQKQNNELHQTGRPFPATTTLTTTHTYTHGEGIQLQPRHKKSIAARTPDFFIDHPALRRQRARPQHVPNARWVATRLRYT